MAAPAYFAGQKRSNMRQKSLVALLCLLGMALPAAAQTDHHAPAPEHASEFRHFRIAPLIGHTFVPAGHLQDHFAIPSWGLDIEYWFNPRWGVGLHNDLEMQSFIIERVGGEEFLERDYPLVVTLDALFKPWRELVLVIGPGYELERNENFFLFRIGLEYEFELNHHWDLAPTFFYDSRQNAFNTWSVALGVGKRF